MVIPGLIEMHCHILPGVDDGSKDTETSLKCSVAWLSKGQRP